MPVTEMPAPIRKLEAKVMTAGAAWTRLETEKRGRYRLSIASWVGWSPSTDSRITIADEPPDKSWIALEHFEVKGEGRGWVRYSSRLVCFITTHSLQRTCERWQVKTLADMEKVIKSIATVCIEHICNAEDKDEDWGSRIPPDGIRLKVGKGGATLVCKKHDAFKALVVVTVL